MTIEVLEDEHSISQAKTANPRLSARDAAARFAFGIFKFFASLKLAIFILLTLMAVLTAGTFLESLHGTDAARLVVYESAWFSVLLILLGANVAAAALDRLPWKKKHTGFVLTHAGIILILLGSLVTQRFMVDAQMMIEEGQTEHRINLPEPLLYIFSEKQESEVIVPLKKRPFPWQGRVVIASPGGARNDDFVIYLLADYPKARKQTRIEPAKEGPGILRVSLESSFVNQNLLLIENDASQGTASLGPATVRFTDKLLKENSGPAPAAGYLEFQFDPSESPTGHIPLTSNLKLPAVFPLEGTPYKVKLLRLFKNATVEGRELIEQENHSRGAVSAPSSGGVTPSLQQDKNPAVELILEGNGIEEKHTIFAKFPEFPTLHGMKPSAAGVRILYRVAASGSKGETHELRFAKGVGADRRVRPEGEHIGSPLRYQIQDGFEIRSGDVKTGEKVSLGWMDLLFRVDEYLPHAKLSADFTKEPNTSTSEEVLPAIQLALEKDKETKTLWLSQGVPEKVEFGGRLYHFLYGEKHSEVGFQLQLKDFKIQHYPGTNQPASFESDVILKDLSRGEVRETTISMNRPLLWRGWKIYQSGYSLPEGGPEISIFSVGRDPGIPLKYAGALVMIAGIVTMFYTRRFSSHAGQLT